MTKKEKEELIIKRAVLICDIEELTKLICRLNPSSDTPLSKEEKYEIYSTKKQLLAMILLRDIMDDRIYNTKLSISV